MCRKDPNVLQSETLLDYLRRRRQPSCTLQGPAAGHFLVSCGNCQSSLPETGTLVLRTVNLIELQLEPCLGRDWTQGL
jgi:xanthine dehydrogenase iron-sulfur cluster and FAD-binding subunit A